MEDTLTDVRVAEHRGTDPATEDFDALVAAVRAKTVRIEAAILVTHDAGGNVSAIIAMLEEEQALRAHAAVQAVGAGAAA